MTYKLTKLSLILFLLVQVSYAIGVAKPMGIYVNTYGTSKVKLTDSQIASKISEVFDMRPAELWRCRRL